METFTLLDIGKLIVNHLQHLDWTFIISFILLAYGATHIKEKEKLKIKSRYLVAILGIGYGIALAFLRKYHLEQIDTLIQSFVFALVFHKLLIDTLLKLIKKLLLQDYPSN